MSEHYIGRKKINKKKVQIIAEFKNKQRDNSVLFDKKIKEMDVLDELLEISFQHEPIATILNSR